MFEINNTHRFVQLIFDHFQLVRDVTVAFLGQLRYGRFDVVRSNWDKELHQILGSAHVRLLFRDKRHRAAEHAHRHDV